MIEAVESQTLNRKRFEARFAKDLLHFRARAGSSPLEARDERGRQFLFFRCFDAGPFCTNISRAVGCVKLNWACRPQMPSTIA